MFTWRGSALQETWKPLLGLFIVSALLTWFYEDWGLGRFSFYHMWQEALAGRLPLRDTFLFGSFGVFWLFLSVKVLETRKWN